MRLRHCGVVISDVKVTTLGMGLIGTRSTPGGARHERPCVLLLHDDIRTNDHTIGWHVFTGNLEPATRSGTEIDDASRRFQERVLFVELDEFEGRTGAVTLLPEDAMSAERW